MLADIFVVQLRAANSSPARGKVAIEDVPWDEPILHPVHVADPSQPGLSEQHEHGGKITCKQRMWKPFSLHSCLEYVVHASLP